MSYIKPAPGLIPRFNLDLKFSDLTYGVNSLVRGIKPDLSFVKSIFGETIFFTNSGRVSLYILLKSLKLPKGAKVGVPLYSCTVVFDAILKAGWDKLVEILDLGGYVRYDFKTATKLLEIAHFLKEKYDGNLQKIHDKALNSKDLERKLMEFKGVGETTINIFLRELRETWKKANPPPQPYTLLAAKNLGLIKEETTHEKFEALKKLKTLWENYPVKNKNFTHFEAALTKIGKNYCRKNKCNQCPIKNECKTYIKQKQP